MPQRPFQNLFGLSVKRVSPRNVEELDIVLYGYCRLPRPKNSYQAAPRILAS